MRPESRLTVLLLSLDLNLVPAWAGDWKLVWADEFDKPGAPDPSKWGYETGFVRNNEAQYYALEWEPDRLEFFVDDHKFFTYRNEGTGADSWPFDKDQYIILNLAIGRAWGGRKGD
jgi:beta-glucanase (GH16 family)